MYTPCHQMAADKRDDDGRGGALRMPITDSWRAAVNAEIEDRPAWSRARLARELGLSKAAVTLILDGKRQSSTSVGDISRLLGVPLPWADDLREQDLIDDLRTIRERDPRAFDRIALRVRKALEDLDDK